jgi:hypothetical protein
MNHSQQLFIQLIETIQDVGKRNDALEFYIGRQLPHRCENLKLAAREMNLRGIRTSKGGRITHTYLRKLVTRVSQNFKDNHRPEFEEDTPTSFLGLPSSFDGDERNDTLRYGF